MELTFEETALVETAVQSMLIDFEETKKLGENELTQEQKEMMEKMIATGQSVMDKLTQAKLNAIMQASLETN